MSGSFGEMGNLLKQAQEMQRQLERVREEVKTLRVVGRAGGDAVRVEVDGDGAVLRVWITPDASSDARLLEELVLAAARDAQGRAALERQARMGKVMGGLPLPGFS
ncbi:MAG: YbaB/EbfC family nucleoid-associated protein [Planctomycetes bacterium]|nr:YbaB/EbfC family nucleoid-associated protein [Planctomycetota bacterium]